MPLRENINWGRGYPVNPVKKKLRPEKAETLKTGWNKPASFGNMKMKHCRQDCKENV